MTFHLFTYCSKVFYIFNFLSIIPKWLNWINQSKSYKNQVLSKSKTMSPWSDCCRKNPNTKERISMLLSLREEMNTNLQFWMDGWLGGDNWPSIYFIFKYDNKQFTLIPKMCSKVAFAYRIRSYEHFKFQI